MSDGRPRLGMVRGRDHLEESIVLIGTPQYLISEAGERLVETLRRGTRRVFTAF